MSARAMLRLAAIALLLLASLLCWMVARPFGKGPFWVRFFLARTGRLLGLRVAVEGRPVPGHVLYAANHISWLDILAVGGTIPVRFIAKSEIAGWSLVGRLATIGGSVYIDRERRGAARLQADAVAVALGEALPVVLFAEGGTGDGIALAPFRPALFAAAVEAGGAVQPVAIAYGARAPDIAWPDDTRFAVEMTRILDRRGRLAVTLHFGAPLDPAALDRKALAAAAHDAVAAALAA